MVRRVGVGADGAVRGLMRGRHVGSEASCVCLMSDAVT